MIHYDTIYGFFPPILLGQAKVNQVQDVGLLAAADEEVIGLDVAVNEVFRVQILDPAQPLRLPTVGGCETAPPEGEHRNRQQRKRHGKGQAHGTNMALKKTSASTHSHSHRAPLKKGLKSTKVSCRASDLPTSIASSG